MVVMNTKQIFNRLSAESLIVIPCKLGIDPISLAIDTGASHTTIDITPLLLAGYNLSEAIGMEKIETASNVIDAYVFILTEFTCLGFKKRNFKVCAYDFFSYHYMGDFDGVVGLDFFEGTKFCIDMTENEITVQLKSKK